MMQGQVGGEGGLIVLYGFARQTDHKKGKMMQITNKKRGNKGTRRL
jgi:hypothetical protein